MTVYFFHSATDRRGCARRLTPTDWSTGQRPRNVVAFVFFKKNCRNVWSCELCAYLWVMSNTKQHIMNNVNRPTATKTNRATATKANRPTATKWQFKQLGNGTQEMTNDEFSFVIG